MTYSYGIERELRVDRAERVAEPAADGWNLSG